MLKNFAKQKKGRTFVPGKMAEWSIAPVLKTDELRGSGGSNPSLSAKEAKQGDVEEIRHLFFVLVLRHANLFVGRGSEIKVVDLSTPCFAYFARSPTASEGKDERSDVNPSLSAPKEKRFFASLFLLHSRASFSRWRLGRVVCEMTAQAHCPQLLRPVESGRDKMNKG